jgi:S1-C subfamily serine protease
VTIASLALALAMASEGAHATMFDTNFEGIRSFAALARPFGHPKPEAHPGYLGISILDLNGDQASQLHLKDTRGALILTIDRDAPAASAGLRARDVILELDGHHVDNVDQLRHRLGEAKAGTTIKLRISRDGVQQTISVQLGDEEEIARKAWEEHVEPASLAANGAPTPLEPLATTTTNTSTFVPPKEHTAGSSFLGVFSMNALYTGAELDPLSTQLAYFFGIHDGAGLLVRTVDQNSPAAAAGLQAGDVILRVNSQPVVSRVDWIKQLRANRGRSMQLVVMRNHREQTTTLVSGPAKKN